MIQSSDRVRVSYMSDLGSPRPGQPGSTMTTCTARFIGLDSRPDTHPFAEPGGVEVIALFDDIDGRIGVPVHLLEDVQPVVGGARPTAIIHDDPDAPMFRRPRAEYEDDEEGMGTAPEYSSNGLGYAIGGSMLAVAVIVLLVLILAS